jgi:hypothetical protein
LYNDYLLTSQPFTNPGGANPMMYNNNNQGTNYMNSSIPTTSGFIEALSGALGKVNGNASILLSGKNQIHKKSKS